MEQGDLSLRSTSSIGHLEKSDLKRFPKTACESRKLPVPIGAPRPGTIYISTSNGKCRAISGRRRYSPADTPRGRHGQIQGIHRSRQINMLPCELPSACSSASMSTSTASALLAVVARRARSFLFRSVNFRVKNGPAESLKSGSLSLGPSPPISRQRIRAPRPCHPDSLALPTTARSRGLSGSRFQGSNSYWRHPFLAQWTCHLKRLLPWSAGVKERKRMQGHDGSGGQGRKRPVADGSLAAPGSPERPERLNTREPDLIRCHSNVLTRRIRRSTTVPKPPGSLCR